MIYQETEYHSRTRTNTFDVTEAECTLVRKLDYKLYEDEKYHYGVCGMLQDVENAHW